MHGLHATSRVGEEQRGRHLGRVPDVHVVSLRFHFRLILHFKAVPLYARSFPGAMRNLRHDSRAVDPTTLGKTSTAIASMRTSSVEVVKREPDTLKISSATRSSTTPWSMALKTDTLRATALGSVPTKMLPATSTSHARRLDTTIDRPFGTAHNSTPRPLQTGAERTIATNAVTLPSDGKFVATATSFNRDASLHTSSKHAVLVAPRKGNRV